MSIILNDNLEVRAPKSVDSRYLSATSLPYTSVSAVNSAIPGSYRYIGLTVNINGTEYWYQNGIGDGNLVIKSVSGGERIQKSYTQVGHTFIKGDVVGYKSTTAKFSGATANILSPVIPIGMVGDVTGTTFTIVFNGYYNFGGTVVDELGVPLSASTLYYLSRNNPGKLTKTKPTALNDIDKPVLAMLTTTDCVVLNDRGILVQITGSTTGLTVTWNNVIGKPPILTGATKISNVGTGVNLYAGITGNSFNFRRISAGIGMGVVESGNTIILSSSGGTGGQIGVPTDGTYLDGLFPFTSGTTVANAIDPINQVLKGLAPEEAPNLTNINSNSTLYSGKLSFGTTNPIAGYVAVTTAAGNTAINTNGNYNIAGTRAGIINGAVGGVLNSNVVGNIGGPGIPYENAAFGKGDRGSLALSVNGVLLSTLALNATTGATSNAYMSVSAIKKSKFANGSPFNTFSYRTGTYTIPTVQMNKGFNYVQIQHADGPFVTTTNYVEWVYDDNTDTITVSGTSLAVNMTGLRTMSGVRYHTGGNAVYSASYNNAQKNVYSNSSTAINFPSRTNLASVSIMNVTGGGVVDRIANASQALPDLDTAVSNPQNYTMSILATLPINGTKVLGSIGVVGQIATNSSITHVFPSKTFTGGNVSSTGYLMYNVTETSTLKTENFNGETYRLQNVNYVSATYANIDGGTYAWNSAQHLVTGNSQHNTGLLVFDGALLYPNSAYLTTTYGITTGNFAAVANAQTSNPNYTSASGVRDEYRKFKSTNVATQSTLTFQITNTGALANFLTDGGTGGTPSGDNIKFEFLIKRANGDTHGWANPFATSGNPEGIARTSATHSAGVTTVTCTLSTVPRVSNTDLVLVRVLASSGWTKIITGITVQNI